MSAPLVDETRLAAWLADRVGPGGDLRVERHQAGHSNETFFLSWGGREMVLRRPPTGAFLPTAHDVLREHRVLAGLAGTRVRSPRPIAACEDEAVIGAPFYLVEKVEGLVVRDRAPPAWGPEERRRAADDLVDALVELHTTPWQGTPLAAIGRPDGYLVRQVRRWTGQMEMTLPFTEEARAVPDLVTVAERLAATVPPSPATTVVHGDYKLDNVMYRGDRVAAILDWEMSTLGDPLADLGWLLSFWREPGDPVDDLLAVFPRLTEAEGFPPRAEMVARWERGTGLEAANLPFYTALAVWKLAILLEGSFARHLAGATDDPFFAHMETGVPVLARRALAIVRGERTA